MGTQDVPGYTRLQLITRINMGTQDILGDIRYTVLQG